MTAPLGLLDAVSHLPPFRLDGVGRVSLADYPGRTATDDERRLVGSQGPHPSAEDLGLPALSTAFACVPDNAARFESTHTPLEASSFGRPLEKLSWCPRSSELLFVIPPRQHATARGTRPFHDYVRLIVLREHGLVLARPCVPTWSSEHGPQLTLAGARLSTILQLQAWRVFVKGTESWSFELNVNNHRLHALTGRRGW